MEPFYKYNPVTRFVYSKYLDLRTRGLERLFFTATTGRTGTLSLVNIFKEIAGAAAYHEPYPIMNEDVLWEKAFGNDDYVNEIYRYKKSINIKRGAVGCRYYMESNHLFIKTFIENVIAEFGNKVSVIVIKRDPIAVANSIYQLADEPGTAEGNKWWLIPGAPSNITPLPETLSDDPAFSGPFYRALWYCHEMDARIESWRKKLPAVPFIDFKTEDINDAEKLDAFLTQLSVEYDKSILGRVANTRKHARSEQKVRKPLPVDDARRMYENYIQLMNDHTAREGVIRQQLGLTS